MTHKTLQDFYLYDLTGNEVTDQDEKYAFDYGLIPCVESDKWFLIGTLGNINKYLDEYIGVELVPDYLIPLKYIL